MKNTFPGMSLAVVLLVVASGLSAVISRPALADGDTVWSCTATCSKQEQLKDNPKAPNPRDPKTARVVTEIIRLKKVAGEAEFKPCNDSAVAAADNAIESLDASKLASSKRGYFCNEGVVVTRGGTGYIGNSTNKNFDKTIDTTTMAWNCVNTKVSCDREKYVDPNTIEVALPAGQPGIQQMINDQKAIKKNADDASSEQKPAETGSSATDVK